MAIKPPVDLKVIGSTGLKNWSGLINEEDLPELRGARWYRTVREMTDQDSLISGILFAIEMLCRQVSYSIVPGGDSPEDEETAHFVESCFTDMSMTWEDTLSEILSMLAYGWSYLEIVYKRREGDGNDPTRRSRFNDGMIGWRKWAIRSQDTLFEWKFDEDGDVQAMIQRPPPTYQTFEIPIEKALLFRTTSRKHNPEGRSILRGAYRSWYFKKNIERIEAIGIERDLAGLPIAWIPPELMDSNASEEEKATLAAIKKIVTQVRNDQSAGIVFPLDYDDKGNKRYDFGLLTSGGSRLFDTDKIIQRYDRAIAISVLADFILLGHEKVGSFALADSKTSLFAVAVGAWLDSIAAVINNHGIKRLLRLNGIQVENPPTFQFGDLEKADLGQMSAYLQSLSSAGMPLFPNPELERFLLDFAGLPVPAEGDLPSEQQEMEPEEDDDVDLKDAKAADPKVENQTNRTSENSISNSAGRLLKFYNPYHDARGRFASKPGGKGVKVVPKKGSKARDIYHDLKGGMAPSAVAKKHGVTPQSVHQVKSKFLKQKDFTPPTAAKPAREKKQQDDFPDSPDGLKTEKSLGGSTGAKLVSDAAGNKFVQKQGASKEHLEAEFGADRVYQAAGARVPDGKMYYDKDGNPTKLTKYMDDAKPLSDVSGDVRAKANKQLQDHFVLDAVMGNRDVVGLSADNILVDKHGNAHRIDNGSSFDFRAQGGKKEYTDKVGELQTMRDPKYDKHKVFQGLTDAQIRQQALDIHANRDAIIAAAPAKYRDTLSKRIDDVLVQTGGIPAGKTSTTNANAAATPSSPAAKTVHPKGSKEGIAADLAAGKSVAQTAKDHGVTYQKAYQVGKTVTVNTAKPAASTTPAAQSATVDVKQSGTPATKSAATSHPKGSKEGMQADLASGKSVSQVAKEHGVSYQKAYQMAKASKTQEHTDASLNGLKDKDGNLTSATGYKYKIDKVNADGTFDVVDVSSGVKHQGVDKSNFEPPKPNASAPIPGPVKSGDSWKTQAGWTLQVKSVSGDTATWIGKDGKEVTGTVEKLQKAKDQMVAASKWVPPSQAAAPLGPKLFKSSALGGDVHVGSTMIVNGMLVKLTGATKVGSSYKVSFTDAAGNQVMSTVSHKHMGKPSKTYDSDVLYTNNYNKTIKVGQKVYDYGGNEITVTGAKITTTYTGKPGYVQLVGKNAAGAETKIYATSAALDPPAKPPTSYGSTSKSSTSYSGGLGQKIAFASKAGDIYKGKTYQNRITGEKLKVLDADTSSYWSVKTVKVQKEDGTTADVHKEMLAQEGSKLSKNTTLVNSGSVPAHMKTWQDVTKSPPADFKNYWNKTKEKLSDAEVSSLRAYTGAAFDNINAHLRAGHQASSTTPQHIKSIDAAMKRPESKLDRDMTIYRGTDDRIDLSKLVPGATFTDKGYPSTSIDRSVSENWKSGMFLEIKAPKGTPGVYVASFSNYGSEKEILLDRNLTYRVLAVDKTPGSRPKVTVEVVPNYTGPHFDIRKDYGIKK